MVLAQENILIKWVANWEQDRVVPNGDVSVRELPQHFQWAAALSQQRPNPRVDV